MSENARQHAAPIIIEGPNDPYGTRLKAYSDQVSPASEECLQNLLAQHPGLIPIQEIEPGFGPLTCLGREIPVAEWAMDVLYVSPRGHLTLAETKLWANPEARRKVVAQIIEYASRLAKWSFEDLDNAVRKAIQPEHLAGKGVLDILEADRKLVDEVQFKESVTRNLRRGQLLLLIIGDRIGENVESIASYLNAPGLHFSLRLVELALYRVQPDREWPILIQPRVVARSVEIERAVIDVRLAPGLEATVREPKKEEVGRPTLTETAFFDELASNTNDAFKEQIKTLIAELSQLGLVKRWRAKSVSLRLSDPGESGNEFTVVVLTTTGKFYLGWLSYTQSLGGSDLTIAKQYLHAVVELTGAKELEDSADYADAGILLERKQDFLTLVRGFVAGITEAAKRAEQ